MRRLPSIVPRTVLRATFVSVIPIWAGTMPTLACVPLDCQPDDSRCETSDAGPNDAAASDARADVAADATDAADGD